MKRTSPNVFMTSVMATGVALAAVGCGEDVDTTPPASSSTSDRSSSPNESTQVDVPEKREIVFGHPDNKPYNPARAKAESCLFEAVQKAAGYMSLSTEKERTANGISYDAASIPSSILTNEGVSSVYPIRMRVNFDLAVNQPAYHVEGSVDVNATHPRREEPFVRPDDAVLTANPDNGKSYWMSDDTYIANGAGETIQLGEVNTDEASFEVCGMVHGNQGTAGFMTAAKYTYE